LLGCVRKNRHDLVFTASLFGQKFCKGFPDTVR
jgi:hypothetical protein